MAESASYVLKSKNKLTEGIFEYFPREDGGATLLRCMTKEGEIEVPATACGRPVVSIGAMAFAGCDQVTSIVIAPTITSIERRAFEGCANLRHLRLPDSLDTLADQLFEGCESLETIIIPDAVTHLEGGFLNGLALRTLRLGKGMRAVDPAVFTATVIGQVEVDPDNPWLSTDGTALFSKDGTCLYACAARHGDYRIAEGCVTVGKKAFVSDKALTSVGLPSTLTGIDEFAFAKSGLTEVEIPGSVEWIGEKAFYYCSDLKKVTLNAGIERIGDEAFAKSCISSIEVPRTVRSLGYRAFSGTHVGFSGEGATFSLEAGNDHLMFDANGGLYQTDDDGGMVFLELLGDVEEYAVQPGTRRIAPNACRFRYQLKRVSVPEGVTEIGDSAFRGCERLEAVDLPDSLEEIGDKVFLETSLDGLRLSARLRSIGSRALIVESENPARRLPPIQWIDLDPANEDFYFVNGMLCQRDAENGDILLRYVGPDPVVEVPEAVTRLNDHAFCNASTLKELYLHRNIKSIGYAALELLKPLQKVRFELAIPVDGCDHDELNFPDDRWSCKAISQSFATNERGLMFNYDAYDRCVLYVRDIGERAGILLGRLAHPVMLTKTNEEYFRDCINHHLREICCYYAERDDVAALTRLVDLGFVDGNNIESTIEDINEIGETFVTGFLLDMKRDRFGASDMDLDLDL